MTRYTTDNDPSGWNDDDASFDDEASFEDDAGGTDDFDDESDESLPIMYCPECGRGVTEDTQKCPHCGDWIMPVDRPRNRWNFKRVMFVIAVLLMLFAMLRFTF